MMVSREVGDQENRFLRWAAIAGILSGVVFVLVPVILFGLEPSTPAGTFKMEGGGSADPAALVATFPSARTPIATANLINFFSDILLLVLVLALYRALRSASPGPALVGSVISVLGLAVLFTETATQVAFDPISSIYHAAGTTPADQATLVLLWQAVQGIFYELDAAASMLLSVGILVLGLAMLRTPHFRCAGQISIVLGAAGFVTMAALGITSVFAALLLIPTFVLVPLMWGWKLWGATRFS